MNLPPKISDQTKQPLYASQKFFVSLKCYKKILEMVAKIWCAHCINAWRNVGW